MHVIDAFPLGLNAIPKVKKGLHNVIITIHASAMASASADAVPSQAAGSETKALPGTKRITVRNPPFTYLHLTLVTSSTSNAPPIDILTARAYLTSAVSQFLGTTGTAIPVDFLKVEGRDVWIRVPREDAAAVVGALSQWVRKDGGVSWRVNEKGDWLGIVAAGDGHKLFQP